MKVMYDGKEISNTKTGYPSLSGKPSINSIELVGNKTSNELNMYTKAQVDALFTSLRSVLVVSVLPATPMPNTTYYVGTSSPYRIWLCDSTGTLVDLGSTEIDMSQYQKIEDSTLPTMNKTVPTAFQELIDTKQAITDSTLTTTDKTVVGAINELDSDKQDKTDDNLQTTDKTIVGAINELLTGGGDDKFYSSSVADVYDDTKTYSVGDFVTYQNKLYKCKNETTGTFVTTDWTEMTVESALLKGSYLPISGGTMTGNIQMSDGTYIANEMNESVTSVYGGMSDTAHAGASLELYGKSNPTNKGQVVLSSTDGTTDYSAVMYSNGQFKWRGQTLVPVYRWSGGVDANSTGNYTKIGSIKTPFANQRSTFIFDFMSKGRYGRFMIYVTTNGSKVPTATISLIESTANYGSDNIYINYDSSASSPITLWYKTTATYDFATIQLASIGDRMNASGYISTTEPYYGLIGDWVENGNVAETFPTTGLTYSIAI